MTATNGPTLIYLRPHDPTRTAIAEYSEHFLRALRLLPGVELVDLLSPDLSERIDSRADRDAVCDFVSSAAAGMQNSPATIVHVEMGNALHREFWAARTLQRLLPRARFFCTVHDPPQLCSKPYRFLRTEFEGRTPIRLLNVALTRAAEWRVARMKRRVEASFIAGCEGIAVLTQTGRDLLASHPSFARARVVRIPHVARLDAPIAPPRESAMQVVYFGFFAPSKGIEELIEAFELDLERIESAGTSPESSQSAETNRVAPPNSFGGGIETSASPKPRLLMFGGIAQGFRAQGYIDSLRERIARSPFAAQIDFRPGFVTGEERDALLAEADIMVLPFRAVPGVIFSSATAIQAMTRAKAVVATRSEALAEEITDGRTGLLYEEGNAVLLADCLHRLFRDRAFAVRLGANARAHIETEHSPERVAAALQEFYRTL